MSSASFCTSQLVLGHSVDWICVYVCGRGGGVMTKFDHIFRLSMKFTVKSVRAQKSLNSTLGRVVEESDRFMERQRTQR